MYEASFENLHGIMNLVFIMVLFICMMIIAAAGGELLRGVFNGELDAETLEPIEK